VPRSLAFRLLGLRVVEALVIFLTAVTAVRARMVLLLVAILRSRAAAPSDSHESLLRAPLARVAPFPDKDATAQPSVPSASVRNTDLKCAGKPAGITPAGRPEISALAGCG
jgi:hypothetical protein